MKHLFALLLLAVLPCLNATAQTVPAFGYLSYDSLLHAMPEYAAARQSLTSLRQKYEAEATYNEQNFRRLFADFLEGQKDFPQNIMLKRQRDLQEEMERGLAFRHEADSLLACAEKDLMRPVRLRLDEAIRAAATERGYAFVLNTDGNACPFVSPDAGENASSYVLQKLQAVRP